MQEDSHHVEPVEPNEDQLAVVEYFASDAYRRPPARRRRAAKKPHASVWPDRVLTPQTSFWLCLFGLSAMLMVVGALSPAVSGWLRAAGRADSYFVIYTMIDQTSAYPALVGFTFVIVTTMFWYGSVVKRFAIAGLLVLPGCLGFLGLALSFDAPAGFVWTFATIVLGMYLAICSVTVLTQMWSHWTLSHSRPIDTLGDPTSTRAIMELTAVAAVGCAVLMAVDTGDVIESLLLYLSVVTLFALSALSLMIAVLRVERRNMLAGALSVLFAFAGAAVYTAMIAFETYGWSELPKLVIPILIASLYGTVVVGAVMWVGVIWLRGCGWICLSRQEEKRVRDAGPDQPWKWFRVTSE